MLCRPHAKLLTAGKLRSVDVSIQSPASSSSGGALLVAAWAVIPRVNMIIRTTNMRIMTFLFLVGRREAVASRKAAKECKYCKITLQPSAVTVKTFVIVALRQPLPENMQHKANAPWRDVLLSIGLPRGRIAVFRIIRRFKKTMNISSHDCLPKEICRFGSGFARLAAELLNAPMTSNQVPAGPPAGTGVHPTGRKPRTGSTASAADPPGCPAV